MIKMIKIYFIVDINGLVYIGSTKLQLKDRFNVHKYDKKKDKGCSSKLLDLDNSIIECIEECTEDMKKEREQYYINNIDCVNKNKLNFNSKKYEKSEKRKQYHKEWYQKIKLVK